MTDEAGLRTRFLRALRYRAYRATHRGHEPWDHLGELTAHYSHVGTATRCKVCGLSIRGPLGWLNRSFWGIAPLSKHPDLCNVCRVGERLLEVTVLFADARGFTGFAEGRPPDEVAHTMNRIFEGCVNTLLEHDAIVDKMMGDAVMAVFGAPIIRPDHAEQAVAAAINIQAKSAGLFPAGWEGACVRLGLNSGTAFVGRVGSGDVKDYTAVGDVVNVAQRLQTEAEPGEVLMSEAVYQRLRGAYPDASRRVLTVKGRAEPVVAYALRAG
ncbi:MAG: adenylate/guanylate cyclase domain-containing protein [Dehalococcoidia bacterium]|nr:adenylate/guanylate cyclase domain-containing protein [Dehalococcoidia bacterium]